MTAVLSSQCRLDAGGCSFVAVNSKSSSVELFSVQDTDASTSQVACFELDGRVMAVHVCSVFAGILVTTLTSRGVGWSWVDGKTWNVEKTDFQEILQEDSHYQGYKKQPISCASIAFVEPVMRLVLSLDHRIFLSSELTTFCGDLTVETSLPFMTNIGQGISGEGLNLNYVQNQGSAVGRAQRGVNVSSSIGGGTGTGGNDWLDGALIKQTLRTGVDDRTVIVECVGVGAEDGVRVVRWCELEAGDNGSAVVAANNNNKSGSSSSSKRVVPPSLRIVYELTLPITWSIATEPFNNDGGDSRKLLYVAADSGKVFLYNVNGPVARYAFDLMTLPSSSAQAVAVKLSPRGSSATGEDGVALKQITATTSGTTVAVTGLMIVELPLSSETRRQVLLSLSNGQYASVLIDEQSHPTSEMCADPAARSRFLQWHPRGREGSSSSSFGAPLLLVRARPVGSLALAWSDSNSNSSSISSGDACGDADTFITPYLPCAERLLQVSGPQTHPTQRTQTQPPCVTVLASHSVVGRQFLFLTVPTLDEQIAHAQAALRPASKARSKLMQRMTLPTKVLVAPVDTAAAVARREGYYYGDGTAPAGAPLTTRIHLPSCPLDMLRGVTAVEALNACAHDNRIPAGVVATGSPLATSSSSSSIQTQLYRCEYGVRVQEQACGSVSSVSSEMGAGVRLLAPSFAGISSGGGLRAQRPVLLTSRAANTTRLVLLHPAETCRFHEKQEPDAGSDDAAAADSDTNKSSPARRGDSPRTQKQDGIDDEGATPSLEKLGRLAEEVDRKNKEKIDNNRRFAHDRFPAFLQVSQESYTVAFMALSGDVAVQVMPQKIRLVQLTPAAVAMGGGVPDADWTFTSLGCGRVAGGEKPGGSYFTEATGEQEREQEQELREESGIAWEFDEEESDGDEYDDQDAEGTLYGYRKEESESDKKKRESRRLAAAKKLRTLDGEHKNRRTKKAAERQQKQELAAKNVSPDTAPPPYGGGGKSTPWSVSCATTLGDVVVVAGVCELCILGLGGGPQASALAPVDCPLRLHGTFRMPGSVSCVGGMDWRGKKVLAVSYWDLPVLQLYQMHPCISGGDAGPALELVCSLAMPPSNVTEPGVQTILSHLSLLPLYFSSRMHVGDLSAATVGDNNGDGNEKEELDLAAQLELLSNPIPAAATAGPPAFTGILALVAGTIQGDLLVYHATLKLDANMAVSSWDVVLMRKITTGRPLRGLAVVEEPRRAEEEDSDCLRALLVTTVSGSGGSGGGGSSNCLLLFGPAAGEQAGDGNPNDDDGSGDFRYTPVTVVDDEENEKKRAEPATGPTTTEQQQHVTEQAPAADTDTAADANAPASTSVSQDSEQESKENTTPSAVAADSDTRPCPALPFLAEASSSPPSATFTPSAVSSSSLPSSRRMAKRIGLASDDSAPVTVATTLDSITSEQGQQKEALPAPIRGYDWGLYPMLIPATPGAGAAPSPETGDLIQLPQPSLATLDTHPQTRMPPSSSPEGGGVPGALPDAVLRALSLGWLQHSDASTTTTSSPSSSSDSSNLTLKLGKVLPGLRYHCHQSVVVPGTVRCLVTVGSHVLVGWNSSASQRQGVMTEGMCILSARTLRCSWLGTHTTTSTTHQPQEDEEDDDEDGKRADSLSHQKQGGGKPSLLGAMAGMAPAQWLHSSSPNQFRRGGLLSLPTVAVLRSSPSSSSSLEEEGANVLASVFAVAPASRLKRPGQSQQDEAGGISPTAEPECALVSLGAVSVPVGSSAVHCLASKGSGSGNGGPQLLLVAGSSHLSVVGWVQAGINGSSASGGTKYPGAADPTCATQALWASMGQELSLMMLHAYPWAKHPSKSARVKKISCPVAVAALAPYEESGDLGTGASRLTVAVAMKGIGIELMALSIDPPSSSIQGREAMAMRVTVCPERSVSFPDSFPCFNRITLSGPGFVNAAAEAYGGVSGSEEEGGDGGGDSNISNSSANSSRPYWRGWRVLPELGPVQERKLALLSSSLRVPALTTSAPAPASTMLCWTSPASSLLSQNVAGDGSKGAAGRSRGGGFFRIRMRSGAGDDERAEASAGLPPLLHKGGPEPPSDADADADAEEEGEGEEKKEASAAAPKAEPEPERAVIKGTDAASATARLLLELEKKRAYQGRRAQFLSKVRGGSVAVEAPSPSASTSNGAEGGGGVFHSCLQPPSLADPGSLWLRIDSDLDVSVIR